MRGTHLYLRLYHGRLDPDQDMEGWGTAGPTFGPIKGVHAAYLSTMQVFLTDDTRVVLPIVEDLIFWEGVYYGDFEVFMEANRMEPSIRRWREEW